MYWKIYLSYGALDEEPLAQTIRNIPDFVQICSSDIGFSRKIGLLTFTYRVLAAAKRLCKARPMSLLQPSNYVILIFTGPFATLPVYYNKNRLSSLMEYHKVRN